MSDKRKEPSRRVPERLLRVKTPMGATTQPLLSGTEEADNRQHNKSRCKVQSWHAVWSMALRKKVVNDWAKTRAGPPRQRRACAHRADIRHSRRPSAKGSTTTRTCRKYNWLDHGASLRLSVRRCNNHCPRNGKCRTVRKIPANFFGIWRKTPIFEPQMSSEKGKMYPSLCVFTPKRVVDDWRKPVFLLIHWRKNAPVQWGDT